MIFSAKSSFIAAFADELRRAREYSGVTLAEVAAVTKVAVEYLESLEAGRWDAVPSPYLRGYLSLYAEAVGMNVDKVLLGFDTMRTAHDEERWATLDSSSPLLPQPERIGLTRAKIRAAWFAALTQNRRTRYLVLVICICILGAGLDIFRRAQRPHISPSPFELTQEEYGQSTRGPMTHLQTFVSDSVAHNGNYVTARAGIIASDTGIVFFSDGRNNHRTVHFKPYDTILIDYDTLTYVRLFPTLSAVVSALGRDSLSPRALLNDTAFYTLAVE